MQTAFSFWGAKKKTPGKRKNARGNLPNGSPEPPLAAKGLALGTCCVWKSEMHDGISERREQSVALFRIVGMEATDG